jgi:type VI secretion system secreted protein Hcp
VGIYMEYGSVKGDATLEAFDKWINLNKFHWEVNRAVGKPPAGKGTGREAQKPDLGTFNVWKETDSASMELLRRTCFEKKPYKCRISFVRTGEKTAYLTYIFHEALITKIAMDANGEGKQEEIITFDFIAAEATMHTLEKNNKRGAPIPFPYYNVNEH